MQVRILFLILGFTSISFQAKSTFLNLSTKDGISSNRVKSITQDKQGFMWFATAKGLTRFDGYNFKEYEMPKSDGKFSDVTIIKTYMENKLIIGTKNNGLFIYESGEFNSIKLNDKNIWIRSVVVDEDDNIWIGSDSGLYKVDNLNRKITIIDYFKNITVVSIILKFNGEILIASTDTLYTYNESQTLAKEFAVTPKTSNKYTVVYRDSKSNLWLGTYNGLYKYSENCECLQGLTIQLNNRLVYSLIDDGKWLWIGTLYGGLYRYSFETEQLSKYSKEGIDQYKISDNNIVSLYVGDNNILWVGTFYEGVDLINLTSVYFNPKYVQLLCEKQYVTYGIIVTKDNLLWIATEKGLLRVDRRKSECKLFQNNIKRNNNVESNIIRSILIDSQNNFWLSTAEGFYQFKPDTGEFIKTNSRSTISSSAFIIEYKRGMLLTGNISGLHKYDIAQNIFTEIKTTSGMLSKTRFQNYFINYVGEYIFSSLNGIYRLTKNMELEPILFEINSDSKNNVVTSIQGNNTGEMWLGLDYKYFIYLDSKNKAHNITQKLTNSNIDIKAMIMMNGNIWISSNLGLYKYDTNKQQALYFDSSDGLKSEYYFNNVAYKSAQGLVYFSGKQGIDSFTPGEIPGINTPPKVAITKIKILGKEVKIGDTTNGGFLIDKQINDLTTLVLNYQDNKINFEFAVLDYANSKKNKYAFRLIGFNKNWEYSDAKNRRAIYTNLNAGEYTFQVKGANKYGIWSDKPKELKIKVYSAPWFSPWAYAAYVFLILISIWSFIRYKTIASRKRALTLEMMVEERTQEVNRQKKMVESLLDHKNEVFANITHEFKTPISLILGPIDLLADEIEISNKHATKIEMIQRNANRLMLMVGQILKLSQSEQSKEVIRESQAVQSTLLMLFESFKPLAHDKGINLQLDNSHDVNIYATSECLEVIVGNLLSNAMKFTNAGGAIEIQTQLLDNRISISVKDSGSGIQEQDITKIFKRFTRLDTHKSIAGTGIGLSVVKEITEGNDGHVEVLSTWGKGSTFTVTFPITDIKAIEDLSQVMVDQLVDNTSNEMLNIIQTPTQRFIKNRITVLIIEDNLDMQTHISSVLKARFNCLFANRGREGIALALKEMPDIVICDVMMPGMDGYQVTRILRHDGRTSHIPIVLLTALNTKESRIKGWRENIDTYIAKPFDAIELNVQLDNILTIRKLLQKETSRAIKTNASLKSLDLPKQDLKFIEKLKDVIGQLYTNEYIQKADIANKMAVSERQLHRKVKALINENPMDMLRDYRLEKAAMKLKDGYQVGIVSDACGFSSGSYFGSCFKKKYGVTPKQYQGINKKH